MKRFSFSITALAAGATICIGALPSQAHGLVTGGVLAGLVHPLMGIDHLLMLVAVGAAASQISLQLLLWALGGGLLGALGGTAGFTWPLLESLAALAVVAVAAFVLLNPRRDSVDPLRLMTGGCLVGAGVAVHGLLHGLEAPTGGDAMLWWWGVLISSAVICGGTAVLLRQLPRMWRRASPFGAFRR